MATTPKPLPTPSLPDWPPLVWGLLIGGTALVAAAAWGWRWYTRQRARKALVATITSLGADHVEDVLVPDGMGGFYHVDFLVLTARGILAVDLRDVNGNVFGGDQMTEWTVMNGAYRDTFTNPQGALYDRVAAVKAALAEDVPVEGRIVFTRRARFPKGLPKYTVMIDSLAAEFPGLDPAALESVVERFKSGWQRLRTAVMPSPHRI